MHYLYILKSNSSGKYYVGETSNIEQRVQEHKQRNTFFGKRNNDIGLVYKKRFKTRSGARRVECFIKRQKSRKFIDKIVTEKYLFPCSSVGRASGC